MTERAVFKNLKWVRVGSSDTAAVTASELPGIYAYAESTLVHGLPSKLEWIYIGKATNLRQRLAQHSVHKEVHPELRRWMQQTRTRETWFVSVPLPALDVVERDLITQLKPRLNRVRYTEHANLLGAAIEPHPNTSIVHTQNGA